MTGIYMPWNRAGNCDRVLDLELMSHASVAAKADAILRLILLVRGQKAIIDSDLALLYGVDTKVLLQSVKRKHCQAFREFMFQLSRKVVATRHHRS